jgi:hypothetical protein
MTTFVVPGPFVMLGEPSGPREGEDWMAGFLFRLEREDGTPAEPSSLSSAAPNWAPGQTMHFGRRTFRVIAVRDDDADSPPVLVVEDLTK